METKYESIEIEFYESLKNHYIISFGIGFYHIGTFYFRRFKYSTYNNRFFSGEDKHTEFLRKKYLIND